MWQDGLILVFSTSALTAPLQSFCQNPSKNSVRATASWRQHRINVPREATAPLNPCRLCGRGCLAPQPRPCLYVRNWSRARASLLCPYVREGFALYQTLGPKRLSPAPWWCGDSIRRWDLDVHLLSHLLSLTVPIPCQPHALGPMGEAGSAAAGSSAAVQPGPDLGDRGAGLQSALSTAHTCNSIQNPKGLAKRIAVFPFSMHFLTLLCLYCTCLSTRSHLKAWNHKKDSPWPTRVLSWAIFALYSSWATSQWELRLWKLGLSTQFSWKAWVTAEVIQDKGLG